jgi:hypothetical protein
MSRIYSNAWKVQIFLGTIEDDVEVGFDYIRREYEFVKLGASPLRYNSYLDHAQPNEKKALGDILTRPWFRRRWVLQVILHQMIWPS